MFSTLTINMNKAHPVDALWWRPGFNMQRELNENLSRMSSLFFPWGVWMDEQELFRALEQNLHRLYSESFNLRQMLTPWVMGSHTAPYVDIVENEKGYIVYADVPGLSEENLDVSAAEDALIIEGRKERHKSAAGQSYIHRECCTAPFKRTIALPEDADPLRADMILKHNVLIIEVPKKENGAQGMRRLKITNGERKSPEVAKMQEKKAA